MSADPLAEGIAGEAIKQIRKCSESSELHSIFQQVMEWVDDEMMVEEVPNTFYELAVHPLLSASDFTAILNLCPSVGGMLLDTKFPTRSNMENLVINICAARVVSEDGALDHAGLFYRFLEYELSNEILVLLVTRLVKNRDSARHVLTLIRKQKVFRSLPRNIRDAVLNYTHVIDFRLKERIREELGWSRIDG